MSPSGFRLPAATLFILLAGCSSDPGQPAGGELQMDRKTLVSCDLAALKGRTFEIVSADPEGKSRKDYLAASQKVASALTTAGMTRRLTAADVPAFEVVVGCVSVNGAPGRPGTAVTRVNRFGEVVRYRSGARAPRVAGTDELTVQIRVPQAGAYPSSKAIEGFPSAPSAELAAGKVFYQGECKAAGQSHDYDVVYGRMAEFLFEDFPGKPGTGDSKTVRLR